MSSTTSVVHPAAETASAWSRSWAPIAAIDDPRADRPGPAGVPRAPLRVPFLYLRYRKYPASRGWTVEWPVEALADSGAHLNRELRPVAGLGFAHVFSRTPTTSATRTSSRFRMAVKERWTAFAATSSGQ